MGSAVILRNCCRAQEKTGDLISRGLGKALGTGQRRLWTWQHGDEFCGEVMHSLYCFASRMTGRQCTLTGERLHMAIGHGEMLTNVFAGTRLLLSAPSAKLRIRCEVLASL